MHQQGFVQVVPACTFPVPVALMTPMVSNSMGSVPQAQPRVSTPATNSSSASHCSPDKKAAVQVPYTESASKGAISQLQEFVQGAKIMPMPAKCPVLQWEYDTHMVGSSLEFRATVAFLLDGVPHHTVGSWKQSKKLAQRDAAERALGLYVNRWGELVATEGLVRTPPQPSDVPERTDEINILEDFCLRMEPNPSPKPVWSHHHHEDGLYQALAEVRILDVPHTFPGKRCSTLEAAYADTARRVLWYLQAPGFEDAFEPDMEYVKNAAQEIPTPCANWVRDGDAEGQESQRRSSSP